MAYTDVTTIDRGEGASSSTYQPNSGVAPSHVTGDYIFLAVNNNTGGTAISGYSGWTAVGTAGGVDYGGARSILIYKQAASGSETLPTLSGHTNTWEHVCWVVKDADSIEATAEVSATSDEGVVSAGSVSLTNADTLIFRVFMTRDQGSSENYIQPCEPTGKGVLISHSQAVSSRNGMHHAIYAEVSSGATSGTFKAAGVSVTSTSQDMMAYTVAINNSSGGEIQRCCSTDGELLEAFGASAYQEGLTLTDAQGHVTTINGKTVGVLDSTPSIGNPESYSDTNYIPAAISCNPPGTDDIYFGFVRSLASSADLTAGLFSVTLSHNVEGWHADTDGSVVYFEDSDGDWVVLKTVDEADAAQNDQKTFYIDAPNATPLDSNGTMDWDAVDKVGFLWLKANTSGGARTNYIGYMQVMGTIGFVGGSASRKLDPRFMADALQTMGSVPGSGESYLGVPGRATSQGTAQDVIVPNIQIGNGSTKTYYSQSTASYELQTGADSYYQAGDNDITITFYPGANDTFDFSASVSRTGSAQNMGFHASSSASATLLTSGWSVIGWDFTGAVNLTGVTFIDCGEIDGKAATYTNCVFKESRGPEAAIHLDDGGGVPSSTFTKGSETYAIETDGVGDTIDLTGATFSNYTTEVDVDAATGTTTISIATTDSTPDYETAGAAVDIDNAAALTITAVNIADDSRYQLYNVTQAAELVNALVSGGSGVSYATNIGAGEEVEAGDTIRLRATYASGTTYKEPIESLAIASAGGTLAFADTQSAWTVVNDLSINGSAQTEFSADYADDEVDITVASNFSGTELQAWWAYNLTTSQGISDFSGGVTLADGSFQIHNASVDIYLDNTTATNLRETQNVKIFRDDEAYPVKGGGVTTGGGGIDIKWRDPIYTKNVGGSALTSGESSHLLALDTASINTIVTEASKILKNRNVTDPAENKQKIYDDDGTTVLLEADLFEDADGSTPWDGDAAILRRDALAAP